MDSANDPIARAFASALAAFVATRAEDGVSPAPHQVSTAAVARAAAGGAAMGWTSEGIGGQGGVGTPAAGRPSFLGEGHHGYAAAREAAVSTRVSDGAGAGQKAGGSGRRRAGTMTARSARRSSSERMTASGITFSQVLGARACPLYCYKYL